MSLGDWYLNKFWPRFENFMNRACCFIGLHEWILNGVRSDRFIYRCATCDKNKTVFTFAEVPDRWLR